MKTEAPTAEGENKKMRHAIITATILAMVAGAPPVYAEPAPTDSKTLESITVTAEKRSEDIQDVPVTISAFTQSHLDDAGIRNIEDLVRWIPNMLVDDAYLSGTKQASFRGLNYSAFTSKNPVVIFVDGVPMDDYSHYQLDLVNVERIPGPCPAHRHPKRIYLAQKQVGAALRGAGRKEICGTGPFGSDVAWHGATLPRTWLTQP